MWQRKLIKNFSPLWWWCYDSWVWFCLVLMGFLCGFCGFDGSLMWVLLALGLLGFRRVVLWQNSDGGAMVVGFEFILFSFFSSFFMESLMWVCNEIFEVDFVGFSNRSTVALIYMVVPWICCIWWCCGGILSLWSMLRVV